MRFIFDTNIIINYIRADLLAKDAILKAKEEGQIYIPLISLMELHLPGKKQRGQMPSKAEIERQIKVVKQICTIYGAKIIPLSNRSQEIAHEILENPDCRSMLGLNALTDSLIIGLSAARRTYLVTRDKNWWNVAKRLPHLYLKIKSPENIVQEF